MYILCFHFFQQLDPFSKSRRHKVNKVTKTTYGELYQNTLKKQRFCEECGYTYISIWESEWFRFKDSIILLQKRWKEYLKGYEAKPEKKRRGRPRKNKKIESNEELVKGNDLIASLVAEVADKSTDDDDEEESINVKKITINSVMYLISHNDDIYDFDSHEHIGVFKNGVLDIFN